MSRGNRFDRIYSYIPEDAAPDERLFVLRDLDGWLYLKKLVESEGLRTPFPSIRDIELYVDTSLTLEKESEIDVKIG